MKLKYKILIILLIFPLIFFGIKKLYNKQTASNTQNKQITSYWTGKSYLTLGDSITKVGGYQKYLLDSLKFKNIDNKGINGQTMGYQVNNTSTLELGKTLNYKNYDLVTIFIGTNDFRYHKPIGKLEDINSASLDSKTYIGAYQLLINYIKKSNPNITIVLITPLQRVKDGFDIHYFNNDNNQLIDYVNATKKVANLYSLPVIDLYAESGITKENINKYTTDGLHLNDEGYKVISTKIEYDLNKIKKHD